MKARRLNRSDPPAPFWAWWKDARSGMFHTTMTGIECGGFSVPYSKIQKAVLYSPADGPPIPSLYGFVLRLTTGEATYDFSIPSGVWKTLKLPFPINREKVPVLPRFIKRWLLVFLAAVVLFSVLWQIIAN